MAPTAGKGLNDLAQGAVLQCLEAATLGMPFEVWKTRMGRFRNENTIQAFMNVYRSGGGGFSGVRAFWAGTSAKMVESATKGAVLVYAKELLLDACLSSGLSPTLSGVIAGAGGGVIQTSVMGPCTFLVTAVVTSKGSVSEHLSRTWKKDGIKGFYPGGTAIAFRQATNWASRQGFTEAARSYLRKSRHGNDPKAKLSVGEEVAAGITGGALACWNHPFEVARIEMQSRAVQGQTKISMMGVFKAVYGEYGVPGLFKGVVPRLCLGIWQTLFMVTGVKLVQDKLFNKKT